MILLPNFMIFKYQFTKILNKNESNPMKRLEFT